MSNYIYNEMMVHIPLCSHKLPETILVLGDTKGELAQEIARHLDFKTDIVSLNVSKSNYENVKSIDTNCLEYIQTAKANSYDVVIVDQALTNNDVLIAHVNRVLKEDGLSIFKGGEMFTDLDKLTLAMKELGKYFKILMPYKYETLGDATKTNLLIFASKLYHPTADIILHRSDMLDNLEYYNCDIHPASFAMPNSIRTALKGISKN